MPASDASSEATGSAAASVAVSSPVSVSSAAEPQAAADYRVKPRETLIGIAGRLLVDPALWPAVARFNGLREFRRLRPGLRLHFPPLA